MVTLNNPFVVYYVNNILEKDNQEETPVKWEKKRLKIFP